MAALKLSGLVNRVALVTGSTSGIGLEVAQRLAASGCNVVLSGSRDQSKVQGLQADMIKKYNVRVDYVRGDLTKMEKVPEMCENVRKIHPQGIDVLINNAGFQHVCPIADFPIEKWTEMIQVHLSTPFALTRHFLPDMQKRGWGRIVNMSSVHGIVASPNKSAYVAAKHGIMGLTKVTALESAGTGVVCNAICPGYVDTPLLQHQIQALADKEKISYDEATTEFVKEKHPSGQCVQLEHIVDSIMFLCSDSAAQLLGSHIVMDGGWVAR